MWVNGSQATLDLSGGMLAFPYPHSHFLIVGWQLPIAFPINFQWQGINQASESGLRTETSAKKVGGVQVANQRSNRKLPVPKSQTSAPFASSREQSPLARHNEDALVFVGEAVDGLAVEVGQ